MEGVHGLVEESGRLLNAGKTQDAVRLLEEAQRLDPQDAQVKEALSSISEPEDGQNLALLCRRYVHDANREVGLKALQAAKDEHLSQNDVLEILDIFSGSSNESAAPMCDEIVSQLLGRPIGASTIAKQLLHNPTELYRRIWSLGKASLDAVIKIPMSVEPWNSEENRKKALQDSFSLLLAQLIHPAQERREALMGAVANIMTRNAQDIVALVDEENLSIILSFIGPEHPQGLRTQATLVVAKFLEANPARGQELLTAYVTSRVAKNSNDDLVAAFSVAAAMFPLVPDVAANLFVSSGFTKDLVLVVQNSRSSRLLRAVLDLLSAACIDKECRRLIRQDCLEWLIQDARQCQDVLSSLMAAVVLSKISSIEFNSSNQKNLPKFDIALELVPQFKRGICETDETPQQLSVEGLAYSSTISRVKEDLSKDAEFLKRLVKILKDPLKRGAVVFGGLTVFANLTGYSPSLSTEEKRMAQIRAFASQSKIAEHSTPEEDSKVALRCQMALEAGVVSVLRISVKTASPVVLNLVASIALSLSREKQHCRLMIQQGLLDVLLSLGNLDLSGKGLTDQLRKARSSAAGALAKVLIPVDPALVFKDRSIHAAVHALTFLISGQEADEPELVFDATRALTNLAAMSEESRSILRVHSWPVLEPLLDSPRSAIQQASLECILNLAASEAFCQEFISRKPEDEILGPSVSLGNTKNATVEELRFLKILAFTRDEFRYKRLPCMAILSMITNFSEGVIMLARAYNGLDVVVDELRDAQTLEAGREAGAENPGYGDVDMRIRAITVLANVMHLEREDIKQRLTSLKLVEVLETAPGVDGPTGAAIKQCSAFILEALQPHYKETV